MDTSRANLDQLQSNTKYIFLTIILVILSIIGVFLFFKIKTTNAEPKKNTPVSEIEISPSPSAEEVDDIPFDGEFIDRNTEPVGHSPYVPTEAPAGTIEPTVPPFEPQPTAPPLEPEPTVAPIIETPTSVPAVPTEAPSEVAEPIPDILTYDGADDGFTLSYTSSRKVQKVAEPTGHRVVFYRSDGNNIAIHVGNDWSWIHPGRELQNSYNVSGQPAFRYDITTQTLVDVKYSDMFYTIQCVHSGVESLKTECDQLITSFKFL